MERLVDVLDSSGTVIHTYPITPGQPGDEVDDAAYEAKAPPDVSQYRWFGWRIARPRVLVRSR